MSQVSKLTEIVKRFPKKTIGLIGDLIADVYTYGITERISREAPVIIVKETHSHIAPGGAGNVAKNLSSLGAKVKFISITGKDQEAKTLLKSFDSNKVEPIFISTPSFRTITKTRILAGATHTRPQQIVRVDRYNEHKIAKPTERKILKLIEKTNPAVDAWIVSDYGYNLITPTILKLFAEISTQKPVLADSRFNLKLFKNFTIIKPNESEAIETTNLPPNTPTHTLAQTLKSELTPQAVIITLGNKGMFVYESENKYKLIPAVGTDDIVDLTGAGDTSAAAIILAVASGADYFRSAKIANCAAYVTVMKPGTATCSQTELINTINEYLT